jgi:hypothetical protein
VRFSSRFFIARSLLPSRRAVASIASIASKKFGEGAHDGQGVYDMRKIP